MSIQVLIVGDHRIMRQGLHSLLETLPNVQSVGEAENFSDLLALIEIKTPSVVIMDMATVFATISTTRSILARNPSIKVIVLSNYSYSRAVLEMMRAGVSGYLLKDCAFEEVKQAIHTVLEDQNYITPSIADMANRDYSRRADTIHSSALSGLTSRQYQVFQSLAAGKTSREIAKDENLSVKTIETHRQQIMKKLKIRNMAILTKYAIRAGLTSIDS